MANPQTQMPTNGTSAPSPAPGGAGATPLPSQMYQQHPLAQMYQQYPAWFWNQYQQPPQQQGAQQTQDIEQLKQEVNRQRALLLSMSEKGNELTTHIRDANKFMKKQQQEHDEKEKAQEARIKELERQLEDTRAQLEAERAKNGPASPLQTSHVGNHLPQTLPEAQQKLLELMGLVQHLQEGGNGQLQQQGYATTIQPLLEQPQNTMIVPAIPRRRASSVAGDSTRDVLYDMGRSDFLNMIRQPALASVLGLNVPGLTRLQGYHTPQQNVQQVPPPPPPPQAQMTVIHEPPIHVPLQPLQSIHSSMPPGIPMHNSMPAGPPLGAPLPQAWNGGNSWGESGLADSSWNRPPTRLATGSMGFSSGVGAAGNIGGRSSSAAPPAPAVAAALERWGRPNASTDYHNITSSPSRNSYA